PAEEDAEAPPRGPAVPPTGGGAQDEAPPATRLKGTRTPHPPLHETRDKDGATRRNSCVGRRPEVRRQADQAAGAASRSHATRARDHRARGPGEALPAGHA